MIFLLSELNQIGVWYRLENLTGPTSTLTGPQSLDAFTSILEGSTYNVIVVPVKPVKSSSVADNDASGNSVADTFGTYQITYLQNDFEVGQQLIGGSNLTALRIPDQLRRQTTKTTTTVRNGFVIEDGEDDTGEQDQQRPVSRFAKRLQLLPQNRHGFEWTIDLAMTVQEILGSTSSTSASMSEVLETAEKAIMTGQHNGGSPFRLLRELGNGIDIQDIDEVNSTLEKLTTSDEGHDNHDQPQLRVERLPMPQLGALAGLADLSLNYDHIISDWIKPLPAGVSGRTRLVKEKIARHLAAEVTLASHVLRIEQPSSELETQDEGELPTYQLNLPFRDMPMTAGQGAGIPPPEVKTLPTPSPTATPSITTRASQASAYASQNYYITNITTFTKSLPVSLPRSTQRVLRHWEVGADLDSYDWRSYSRRITRQTEMEDLDSQLTEQERARLQRKAERHLKRERKEAAVALQQQAFSSQLPELVVSASQPVNRPGHGQFGLNSSQTQPVAASQAVQGRHGGRPVKKKRKQGF